MEPTSQQGDTQLFKVYYGVCVCLMTWLPPHNLNVKNDPNVYRNSQD